MAFGDLLKSHLPDSTSNKLFEKYIALAHFFTTECGWSQQDFDEADIEFMNDIITEHIRINRKRGKKKW